LTTLPEGGTTAYSYATAVNPWANNVASVTRTAKPGSPLSPQTTSLSYDPIYNKPTQVVDPLGRVATLSYDPATSNLLSAVADAGAPAHFNATTRFAYDAHGRVLAATDPLGIVTAFAYDSFENLVMRIADSGGSGRLNITTLLGYDALGNVVARTDPNGNTATMNYDADRRLIIATGPGPFSSGPALVQMTYAYDPDGHLLSVTRANGTNPSVARLAYTATGKVQTVTDPKGKVTTNAYDADDRLLSVTDPLYRVTAYGYDAMSRRISVSNPAIQAAPLLQQSYTPDGLIGSLTDAIGNISTFTPDGFDRLATTTYPDSSTEVLGYDADGNVLTRQTRAGAAIGFTYDTLNRLTTKAAPSESTVTYGYDLASHLLSVSDTSAAITAPSAAASYGASYTYDQLNLPTNVSWSPAPSQTTPSGSAAATFGYSYDATNRRVGQTATDNSWWSYPTTATKVSYTANNLNQYTAVGSVSPTYDGNGNLTSDGTFTYGYDAENRLISATGSGLAASYAYDAQGRRKSKTVNGTTTIYVTDADNREVLEYDGTSGATGNWYSFAPASAFGPDAVLNQMNVASGTRGTLIPDVQGSIVGSLDANSGTLTKTGYQAYGENPSLTAGSYQYTARRFDPETAGSASQPSGLYYYRARMYSPAWGRFMQVDPIGYAGGSNLYTFSGNDPTNNLDLGGLWSFGGIIQGSVEAGLWPNFGIGATGSVASGTFYNMTTGAVSQGQFASGGAIAQFNIYTATAPSPSQQLNGVIGASAGQTQGYYFSPNANSLSDLLGPFQTYSLNTAWFSIQVGIGNGIWIFSAGIGPGVGASVSAYPTNTVLLSSTSIFSPQNMATTQPSSVEAPSDIGAETANTATAAQSAQGAPVVNSSSGSTPGK
jgi:RHS repeat-associated protein